MSNAFLHLVQMEAVCQEIRQSLLHDVCLHCVAPSPRQLFLFFKDCSKVLFLGFEKSFLRFHLLSVSYAPSKPEHSVLSSYLKGQRLETAELLHQDRILQLTFSGSYSLIGEFFPRHPNYYLTDANNRILFSLHSIDRPFYSPPPKPAALSAAAPILTAAELENQYVHWQFEQDKASIIAHYKKEFHKIEKQEQQFKQELQACLNWKEVHQEAELLKAHFQSLKRGKTAVIVWDWLQNEERSLALDPLLTPQEQLEKRFRKSKKLQKGIEPLSRQIERIQLKRQALEHKLQQIESLQTGASLLKELKLIDKETPKLRQLTEAASPYYEYLTAAGLKIWVGKNARQNEKLTFQLAHGSDWWLHVQNYPGSHVIIRTPKGKEPDAESLQDAMQLALYHSKARQQGEGEICITQRKFVSRLGKEKGKVQISKHKKAFVRWDSQRYESLKNRQKSMH